MQKFLLLPLFTLLVGCAPATSITSAARSFDRVQADQEWVIEYTLNGQVEHGTFFTKDGGQKVACRGTCEQFESITLLEARVTETQSGTGQITLWDYKSGARNAWFTARRLGHFDEAICKVTLTTSTDTYAANITLSGSTKSEPGSCRVLSVR